MVMQKRIMIIETERLYLREMTEEDVGALYAVLGDPGIMQHYPAPFDKDKVRDWIRRNIGRYRTSGFGLWAVCLKQTGEMIGDCGLTLQQVNGQLLPEIGYHIRADKQRKGYAKEAAIAVRDWTFRNTTYNTVYSYMKHTNIPSIKTAISYGCRKTAEFPDEVNEMTMVYAVSREEWIRLVGNG